MRFRKWRYFFDYAGGNMTDQGTHLMDVVQWFTKETAPRSAVAHGYVAKMKGAEHPDVFSAVFEFPNFMATWTLDYANSFQNGWSITFMGDKATMIIDEYGYKVYAEPWKAEAPPIYEEKVRCPSKRISQTSSIACGIANSRIARRYCGECGCRSAPCEPRDVRP